MQDSLYWYWLYNIEGIGPKTRYKLLELYESPRNIYENVKEEDLEALRIPNRGMEHLIQSRSEEKIMSSYQRVRKKGICIITLADENYPERLRHIYDPPGVLYVRGKLPEERKPCIAIVGARECSNYGKELAIHFAKELAKEGIQIISGLAKGVDYYSHIGALGQLGSTYAVLGCGIDICYPRENFDTYMQILNEGGIISEYSLGYRPLQGNFPMRNRIISGLSDGILLIEARKKSGSLITMDYGLDQGKNIYACPGRITDSLSYGTNHIIQMGGKLVMEPEDILEDYEIKRIINNNNLKSSYSANEQKILDCLSLMPKHIEEILMETGFEIDLVSELLFQLQLKNIVKQVAGSYYAKTMEYS